MTIFPRRTGKTLLVAFAATGAILAYVPVASADPDPNAECPQQEASSSDPLPSGEPPQCDQQGPGVPNLPKPKNDSDQSKKGDLADIHCWMYATGPEWFPPGASPRPSAPGEQVWPCYSVLGLTPHV